jgi:hypothetical protein
VDPITAALQFGRSILERWIPDKTERAKAEAEMAIAVLNGDLQLAAGPLELNKADAGFFLQGRPRLARGRGLSKRRGRDVWLEDRDKRGFLVAASGRNSKVGHGRQNESGP